MLDDLLMPDGFASFFGYLLCQDPFTLSSELIRRLLTNLISLVAGGGCIFWVGGWGAGRFFRGRSLDLVPCALCFVGIVVRVFVGVLEGGVGGVNIGGASFMPVMRPSDISFLSMASSSSLSADLRRSARAC